MSRWLLLLAALALAAPASASDTFRGTLKKGTLRPVCAAGFPVAGPACATVTGGLGKAAYVVSTLANSGAGSLRYGIDTFAPANSGAYITCAVSGNIILGAGGSLLITQSNVTIDFRDCGDGKQGINIGGPYALEIRASNVVLRGVRMVGTYQTIPWAGEGTYDRLAIRASHVVVDHGTFGGADDGNIDCDNGLGAVTNVTVQYSVVGWARAGKNMLLDGCQEMALWRNLLWLSSDRMPAFSADTAGVRGRLLLAQNLLYDSIYKLRVGAYHASAAAYVDAVENVAKRGPVGPVPGDKKPYAVRDPADANAPHIGFAQVWGLSNYTQDNNDGARTWAALFTFTDQRSQWRQEPGASDPVALADCVTAPCAQYRQGRMSGIYADYPVPLLGSAASVVSEVIGSAGAQVPCADQFTSDALAAYTNGTRPTTWIDNLAATPLAAPPIPDTNRACGDLSYIPQCSNGIDDDGDGKVDYAPGESWHDTGCTSATDTSE